MKIEQPTLQEGANVKLFESLLKLGERTNEFEAKNHFADKWATGNFYLNHGCRVGKTDRRVA